MKTCFVIQPFDKDKFDKRYNDIFEPAINKAGYQSYRVDKDNSVTIPIEDIEKNIRESDICFAEISTDNPNVWYELGYAFACKKNVIIVCSEERTNKFPFDIQHRFIITYKTGSLSDFNDLSQKITNKIIATEHKNKTVETLQQIPVQETKGLKSHEIALLILLMENTISKDDYISIYTLKSQMNKSGYTDVATNVGIRILEKIKLIETFMQQDNWNNGQEFIACKLTENGENWVLENQDKLEFRFDASIDENEENDLPF
jgi:hypothetical protein